MIGSALLIAMGIAHAIHVGRADDVEPYLWGASLILVSAGPAHVGIPPSLGQARLGTMPLNIGSRLGHYDVTALIGEGGMGQVYQATDTRLDRTVAIKVLPEHVAADPDLKQRFEREARTVASLYQPNPQPHTDCVPKHRRRGSRGLVGVHHTGKNRPERARLKNSIAASLSCSVFTAVAFLAGVAFLFTGLRFFAMLAPLGQLDVLRARTFRAIARFEGHSLTLPEVVELHTVTGGLVEEVLGAFFRLHEPEAFVTHQPLDCPIRCCHFVSC